MVGGDHHVEQGAGALGDLVQKTRLGPVAGPILVDRNHLAAFELEAQHVDRLAEGVLRQAVGMAAALAPAIVGAGMD